MICPGFQSIPLEPVALGDAEWLGLCIPTPASTGGTPVFPFVYGNLKSNSIWYLLIKKFENCFQVKANQTTSFLYAFFAVSALLKLLPVLGILNTTLSLPTSYSQVQVFACLNPLHFKGHSCHGTFPEFPARREGPSCF